MNSSQHNGMRMHPEDDFQLLGHESTPAAHQAIGRLTSAMRDGDATCLKRVGERGLVKDGKGKAYYVTCCAEEEALAWAARTFAKRAALPGQPTRYVSAFVEARLTTATTKAVQGALLEAIRGGDAASMIGCAARVVLTWGQHHAELPALRALTWAARTLGERCARGDFANATTEEGSTAPRSPTSTPSQSVNGSRQPSPRPMRSAAAVAVM